MATREQMVHDCTIHQIAWLERHLHDSSGRDALAQLRHGIGRRPGAMPQLWGRFLAGMPEECHSASGNPSREEWAVYIALTLFAMHQQSREESVNQQDVSPGTAARKLLDGDGPEQDASAVQRVWKRLAIVAQADDVEELAYRLRQFISLLRARDIGLDYGRLAADLYEFQFQDGADRVRLRWGQDFFGRLKTADTDDGMEDDPE